MVEVLKEEVISFDDGFYFGRGVFETIYVGRKPMFLTEHLQRLNKSLKLIGIDKKVSEGEVADFLRRKEFKNVALKVMVSEKNTIINTRQIPYNSKHYQTGFSLVTSAVRRNETAISTFIKSFNYLENLLEKNKAIDKGFDEALFLNTKGYVCEGSSTNIFFVKDSKIYTPIEDCGLLKGIVRQWVIDNFNVQEGKYSLDNIYFADEVFITNSLIGIMKVVKVDDVEYKQTNEYSFISEKYWEFINAV